MHLRASLLFALPLAALADTLELKDGTLLDGTFLGGTAGAVRFETSKGLQVIPRGEILALTFVPSERKTPEAEPVPAPAPVTAANPPPPPAIPPSPPASPDGRFTLPVGTLLTVRLDDAVDSRTAAGRKFGAKLVADLVVEGAGVVKAGTVVIGEASQARQGGRLAGRSALVLTLTGMEIGGRLLPITTSDHAEQGSNALRKTARNAALGAIIGEATNNDAGGGAAIGLGTAALGRGGSVTFPAGTMLEFELSKPLDISAGEK